MSVRLQELIEAQDFNGLLRAVDGMCAERAWDQLLELADRCEEAVERGKQLWPIAVHIDYRIALEAPGEYAAQVLHPEVGRFALAPLTEVAASTHKWAELSPHVDTPQIAAYLAQERVLRGEDLTSDPGAHPEVLEMPLRVQAWEPTYALATFRSNFVEVAEVWEPKEPLRSEAIRPAPEVDDPELVTALLDLVQPWTTESNGAARAVFVEGDAVGAASCLTYDQLRIGALTLDEALQRMAWAAASGGAHGRRRGAALGRFLAWYTLALCAGLPWPPVPDSLEEAARGLRFYRWEEQAGEEGWILRLAIEHPGDGWAVAIGATDLLQEDDERSGRGVSS